MYTNAKSLILSLSILCLGTLETAWAGTPVIRVIHPVVRHIPLARTIARRRDTPVIRVIHPVVRPHIHAPVHVVPKAVVPSHHAKQPATHPGTHPQTAKKPVAKSKQPSTTSTHPTKAGGTRNDSSRSAKPQETQDGSNEGNEETRPTAEQTEPETDAVPAERAKGRPAEDADRREHLPREREALRRRVRELEEELPRLEREAREAEEKAARAENAVEPRPVQIAAYRASARAYRDYIRDLKAQHREASAKLARID